MSRTIVSPPYSQDDPSPGGRDRRRRRRLGVFIVIWLFGAALLATGHDLQAVLLTELGLGLVATTVARWVTDDAPLPSLAAVLSPVGLPRSGR